MSTESLEIPRNVQRVPKRFEQWRGAHAGRLPIPERLWAAAVELAREHGVFHTARALRLEYSKLKRSLESASPAAKSRRTKGRRGARRGGARSFAPLRVPDRVGRATRQDADSMEGDECTGPGWAEPGVVGVKVMQIAPQMRILVAIEAVDGRKGIDSLARLCQEKLQEDPFSGCLFVFRSRRGTSIRILTYDGQGFWLAQKPLSKGRFVWWPSGKEPTRRLQAHQAQLLLAAGNPEAAAAPVWRGVST